MNKHLVGLVVAAICVAILALIAQTARVNATTCQVSDLHLVFADPMKYRGYRFCGMVYFYKRVGLYGFHEEPFDNAWGVEHPILLPGNVGLPTQELERLHTNDKVLIEGRLEPSGFCFVEGQKCTPFNKPIFIEDLILVGRAE